MTWTKLGDEFIDDAADLSDAAVRTHVEAVAWSNRRGLDLVIPKRDLRRFGFSDLAEQAAADLIAAGWWQDTGEAWRVVYRPEWQQERVVVERRREATALRQRRHRLHLAGDHTLCLHGAVTRDVAGDTTRDPVRDGSVRGGHLREAPTDESACEACGAIGEVDDRGQCDLCSEQAAS